MMKNSGFTLLEMLITLFLASIIVTVQLVYMARANTSAEKSYREIIRRDNQTIAQSLRSYAALANKGFLPAPYTGGAYKNAPVDITNTLLVAYMGQGQIDTTRYNQDDSSVQNVKYMELITPRPSICQPIVGVSSECVTLAYDQAVLYQTSCSINAECNDGTPGVSAPYELSGWTSTAPDLAPVEISTMDIQQALWRETWGRLNEIRFKIRTAFNATVAASAAGDTTNHFFKPNLAGSPNLIGADPSKNQGCRDGWYQLDNVDVNVLEFYGLHPQSVYAITSWGGRLEYCPDFDPAGVGANALPHIAALRINKSVTAGQAPAATIAQNLILVI